MEMDVKQEVIVISDASDDESRFKIKKSERKRAPGKDRNNKIVTSKRVAVSQTPVRSIPLKNGQSSIKNYFKNQSSLPPMEKQTLLPINHSVIKVSTSNTPQQEAVKLTPSVSGGLSSRKQSPRANARSKRPPKVVPAYKIVEGTPYAVDAFQFGDIESVTNYFLTHFHADHYVGLKKSFSHPLHVSEITARLVVKFIGVDRKWIREHQMNVPFYVDDVEVIALDANHCPGAVMFMFRLPTGQCILHTGDFRACADMEMIPHFWNHRVDTLYLDTTYLATRAHFVSQMGCIDDAKRAVRTFLGFDDGGTGVKPLVVIGTYVIGKEKVWISIADAFDLKVWLEPQRRKSAECIFERDDPIWARIVDDKDEATVHVVPLGQVSYPSLLQYLNSQTTVRRILAIRPSGWEKPSGAQPKEGARLSVAGVQYSEHSSYDELKRFVRFLMPTTVIPTVPVSGKSLSITKPVPTDWLCPDVKPQRHNFQRNILSYMSATAQ